MTPITAPERPATVPGRPTNPGAFTDREWAIIAEALRISADAMQKLDGDDVALDAILDVSFIRLKVTGKVPTEAGT